MIRLALGLSLGAPIPAGLIHEIKMGTTVATNALLERKGSRTLLIVDHGYRDLLRIGHQTRPRLFDLNVQLPQSLCAAVEEVGGRMSVSLRPATLSSSRRQAVADSAPCPGWHRKSRRNPLRHVLMSDPLPLLMG